jgi:hypothetical protein
MTQVLEKRTYDARLYDIVCTGLLADAEVVTQVVSVTADQGALTFGAPNINTVPIAYPSGTAAIGKVIQVEISAGTITKGADSMNLGLPNLMCTVRARFKTNLSPNQIEATLLLLLRDQPS